MLAIGSLLLIAAVSLLVTRVATVILTATGLPRHVARFQARSALTNAGFTTSESERVVTHPIRRRVIGTLMLLGSVGLVGAASSAILGLRGASDGSGWHLLELVGGLMILVVISRSARVDRLMTAAISRVLRDHTDVPNRDLSGLLQLSGDYAVQELAVKDNDWLAGRTLAELGLRHEGVVVLVITRTDGTSVAAADGHTVIRTGDNLVLYGRSERLRELDRRPAGDAGARAHEAAVSEQQQILLEQRSAEIG